MFGLFRPRLPSSSSHGLQQSSISSEGCDLGTRMLIGIAPPPISRMVEPLHQRPGDTETVLF